MYPRRLRDTALVLALTALLLVPADPAAARRSLCVHGLEPPAALKVHSGPGEDAAVLGSIPAKACDVKLVGRCVGHWCQMAHGRSFGWIDTRNIGVYEIPDGARAATAGAAPKGSYEPPRGGIEPPPATPSAAAVAPAARGKAAGPVGSRAVVIRPAPKVPVPRAGVAARPEPRLTRPRLAAARPVPRPRHVERPEPRHAEPRHTEPRYIERPEPRRSWAPPLVMRYFGFAAPPPPAAERSACVVDVERGDTLRIRSGPGVQHREIGEIPPRACGVMELGGCYGSWCRVAWRGQHGWVNTRYLE